MLSAFRKISFIIFGNLLAFLTVGHILDAIFDTGATMKFAGILISLPVLGIIMYFKAGGILHELQSIESQNTSHKKDNDGKNNT